MAGIRVDHAEIKPGKSRRWGRRVMRRGVHTMDLDIKQRSIARFSHSMVLLGFRPGRGLLLQPAVYCRPEQPSLDQRWHSHVTCLGPIGLYATGGRNRMLNELGNLIDPRGKKRFLTQEQAFKAIDIMAEFFMDLRA